MLCLALIGCAGKPHYEVTPGYDVATYATYAWATDELVMIGVEEIDANAPPEKAAQPNVRTEANERRLRAAIDAALAERGYTKAPRDQADLLVAFSVGTRVRYRLEGGPDSWIASQQPAETQTKGTLHIYLLHRADQKEAWHGWTSKWLNRGDDPDAVVRDAVTRIMAKLPAHAR